MKKFFGILMIAGTLGCNGGGEDRLTEKTKLEAMVAAKAELEAQLAAKDQLIEKARNEGRAAAEEEIKVQMENMDLLVAKARAEGKAAAEAEIMSQNANQKEKAAAMEADLATRQLFYQAIAGTYEGKLKTPTAEFEVRLILAASLPPYLNPRVRQLDEITSDLNNLSLKAQIVQWNKANSMTAVGCRIENIRPDLSRGVFTIASESCPNTYLLRVSDEKILQGFQAAGAKPTVAEISKEVAEQVLAGKKAKVSEIQGELHPSTNAVVYPLAVKRAEGK